ncbi:hypothetical protein [Candidatus Poriferisodalis sp.]|uniref:hypothetical protein n=1 Tax=Candidatus Poriferisodalis sp. TaxID=3101277 RepID=UPI003B01F6C3
MKAAVALVAALALALPAMPAAAQQPSNFVRSGPNLTLVVASCPGPADNAAAEALAAHARNAAKVCVDPSGLSPDTAALIADFAPDRVIVVGGEVVVPPAVMAELTEAVRAAYRWAIVERLDGATRIDTAALAARVSLEHPDVAGPDAVTLIVANGWNGSEVRTAADVAGQIADAAVAYISPRTIADGLPAATAALIADYRPARVVVVGLPDEVGSVTEAAIEATLDAHELTVDIERVAEAGEPRFFTPEASPSVERAREIFTSIVEGTHQPDAADEASPPLFAASSARGPLGSGRGARLWSIRADGSGRELRSEEHRGWAWNPGDGQLSWSNLDGRLRTAAPDGSDRVLVEAGGYPAWSPDGSHVVTFRFTEPSRQGPRNRIEAHVWSAGSGQTRRLGVVDYRTFLYSDLPLANWSPDGRRFAYVELTDHPETGEQTSTTRIETFDARAPTVTLGEDVTFLGWSPDGSHFAYGTPSDCDGNGRNESQNLWIARSDGSDARDLGFIDRIQWRLLYLWSPDGAHVAYESLDPADCSQHVKVTTAGGEATALEPIAEGRLLGWSPNGMHLGYGITVGTPGKGIPLREHAWVVRLDASDRRELGEAKPTVFGSLLWSADGDHLAYTETLRDADGDVIGGRPVVQRADGIGGPTVVAERGNIIAWSPVDGRVAYVAHYDEDGNGTIDRRALRVHTAGAPDADVTLVYELSDITPGGQWSPDGDYIGYGSGPAELLLDWFISRRRGSDGWVVATSEPRWTHRVVTDITWGEWQPR